MRISRIYSPQALSSGQSIDLDQQASHHLSRVLRIKPGTEIELFNGEGGAYRAEVIEVTKRSVRVQTSTFDKEDRESPLNTHLAIGISRGDRFDWVVQKATELGISAITPLYTERVEVKLKGEREAKKLAHWRQIAISACEQCGRNRVPHIDQPRSLAEALKDLEAESKFVLHHRNAQSLGQQAATSSALLLVGPEGGLSEGEIATAEKCGFQALTLGPRIFRTETAPLAALAAMQARWGDWD